MNQNEEKKAVKRIVFWKNNETGKEKIDKVLSYDPDDACYLSQSKLMKEGFFNESTVHDWSIKTISLESEGNTLI